MRSLIVFIGVFVLFAQAQAQSYENNRCRCVCPSISTVTNSSESSHKSRIIRIANVLPNKCNCEGVILPIYEEQLQNKSQEFCPRCECNFEYRNINIIKYVVIIVIWVISTLVIYMAFLIILDPLLNKRNKGSYQEHTNEEDETAAGVGGPMAHNMSVRGNVLNRVGHQQDKWKRQVKEQRRNIYDRHTMLN
ncbi:PREDICTED: uncharacterized protein CG1161 [Nicrophorus vespilloides]|uniref:Uncharacterized protein CG1161 n=1 Tax=Nicrophorus vespilloides TaxID=110193 RepID=A0ABM1MCV8_NICVS|nr:PREDICTED: uncharacterized protein CG1161 [Nicrophorus vespilloides]XP_017772407.1 PREDICTED: uncharacterized protein CG1161 [Nicrophorus vespilloides]XP_017772408.1 PREDICTED: uncharacterized protein CG1161 [Nicrophorus vespilloides]